MKRNKCLLLMSLILLFSCSPIEFQPLKKIDLDIKFNINALDYYLENPTIKFFNNAYDLNDFFSNENFIFDGKLNNQIEALDENNLFNDYYLVVNIYCTGGNLPTLVEYTNSKFTYYEFVINNNTIDCDIYVACVINIIEKDLIKDINKISATNGMKIVTEKEYEQIMTEYKDYIYYRWK